MPDYELPGYLTPPSPAQAEQLAIQKNEQEQRQQQMFQTLFERMQKRVAFTRMVGRANELQATGAFTDPQDARDQAFLETAPQLFNGQPEQYASSVEQVSGRLQKRKSINDYKAKVQDLTQTEDPDTGELYTPEKAMSMAWALNGPAIAGSSGLGGYYAAQARSETADKQLKSKEKLTGITEEGKNARAQLRSDTTIDVTGAKIGADRGKFNAAEAGRNARFDAGLIDRGAARDFKAVESEKNRAARIDLLKRKIEASKLPDTEKIEANSLFSELRGINKEIEKFTINNPQKIGDEPPREFMVLKNQQTRLHNQIESISKRVDTKSGAEASVPKLNKGDRFDWNGKALIYNDGDPNDLSSYTVEGE